MKKKLLFTIILLSAALFGLFGSASAQIAVPILPPPIEPPMPPIWRFEGLKIRYQRVNITVEDQIATTHIDQLFVNDNDWMLEGNYLFPLPEGAAVSQLTMWIDGTPIEAKILGKDEARQIYDEIVRQLRDPALLEYVGTDAIQANVFPIPPHQERRIEIEYSQILPADNGTIHYVYPQTTDLYTNTPLENQSIRLELRSNEAIRTIYSPSHPVAIQRDGEFQAVAGFEGSNVNADKDFELYYTVSSQEIGLNLLSYKETGQDGFFLLLVAPSIEAEEIIAKDVILVLDTSGSMEGEKMMQAKEAAAYVVAHLNEDDRFNIVSFSTGVRNFTPTLNSASDSGGYRDFISRLEAVGGTNISQALLEAVGQADRQRPTTIIFLTDGLATEGITDTPLLLESIQQAAPSNVRIFAFGVGNDVDTTLLDSLTQNHRGTTTYVRPFQSIDEEVSSFYAKVSAPVLADLKLDFENIVVEQMYPQQLPDLYAGSQLLLAGRYREGGPAAITLSGTINGRTETFTYADNFFRNEGGEAFIPRLWATRAIGHLLGQIRLHGENAEMVQSIVNLSIRYGIITPYTSYLIEEDDIFSQTGRDTIMEEAMTGMAAPASASGEAAVNRAADEGSMAEAEMPMAMPTVTVDNAAISSAGGAQIQAAVEQPIQFVGSKTFVLRNGIWLDTAYDPDSGTAQQVGFASDAYFELLSAAPEVGQYMALGQQVLFIFRGQAYQVVPGEGSSEIQLPEAPLNADTAPAAASQTRPAATPNHDNSTLPETTAVTGQEAAPGSPTMLILAGIVAAMMVGVLALRSANKRRGAQQK